MSTARDPLVIACDIDGVLCEGPYLPVEERTAERYAAMRPYEDAIRRFRDERPSGAIVYYITSRRRHLWRSTLQWLHKHVEPNAQLIAGIDPADKPLVAAYLGCAYLFDDDPKACSVGYADYESDLAASEVRRVLIANPSRGDNGPALASIGDAWTYIRSFEEARR